MNDDNRIGNGTESDGAAKRPAMRRFLTRIRFSRWLMVVLVLSLAGNVFVLGWAGARWASWAWGRHYVSEAVFGDHGHGKRGHGRRHGLEAELAGELWAAHGTRGLEIGEAAIPRLRDLADAMAAEPLDPAALERAIGELEASGRDLLEVVGMAAQDGIDRLSPEDRANMARRLHSTADRLERRFERWQGRIERASGAGDG